MSSVCRECKPGRKCMRCRKSHDSLSVGPVYEYPFEWVPSSGHPPPHLVAVNGKWISRSTSSEPRNAFVGEFTVEIKDSVLTDPKSRHMWKPFTSDFNPDEVNAVKANYGLGWIGSDVYVGRVNDLLGTIYKTEESPWKLQVGDQILDEKKVQCHVLCDRLSITEAIQQQRL